MIHLKLAMASVLGLLFFAASSSADSLSKAHQLSRGWDGQLQVSYNGGEPHNSDDCYFVHHQNTLYYNADGYTYKIPQAKFSEGVSQWAFEESATVADHVFNLFELLGQTSHNDYRSKFVLSFDENNAPETLEIFSKFDESPDWEIVSTCHKLAPSSSNP